MLEKVDHSHVPRVYCKGLVARLNEKFSTFLRVKICVSRMKDLGLNRGLDRLDALRQKLMAGRHNRRRSNGRITEQMTAVQRLIDLLAA